MKYLDNNCLISIIVPVMNEVDNIVPLANEITAVMEGTRWRWECVWIDDFSSDGTGDKLREFCRADLRHKVFFHEKNYGQSAALASGFRKAEGDIFVTLDGDGQNDPGSIPAVVKKLITEQADLVNGRRKNRADNLIRKISSRIGNGFRNILTGEKISDVGCALRAFRRECTFNVPVFRGMHRYFPTLVRISGYGKILEEPVNHRPRERGRTKYGISNRLWVGIADTIAVCWMKRRMVFPRIEETRRFGEQ
jgi:dolichol-phosphate mannosyltransferase